MATSQDVINAAYIQALGRPADPDGLKHYVAQLESGKRVGDILKDLEYAARPVEAGGGGLEDKAANQAITARGGWDFAPVVETINLPTTAPADLDTTNLFTGVGTQGATVNQPVAPPPVTAPLTAQDLYNQFLGGRPALEKDYKFWNNYIAQYGPDQAMAAFDAATQNELGMDLAARAASLREQNLARDGTVMKDGKKTISEGALTAQGLYNEYLGGRSALQSDLDFWNNYIAVYGPDRARAAFQESAQPEKEMPVEERVKSLRDQNLTVPGSLLGEFATQRKATPAEVRSMYLSVLGREPDPEGYSYYTSQPIESLRQNFYQGSIPEMEKRVAAIPVTTAIPKPVIGQVSPQSRGQSVDIPGSFVTTNQGAPKPLTVDISTMPREQQDLTSFIVGKMPRPTTTAPGPMFTPGEVNAQLELERLKAMNAPSTTDQGPVAGFAEGGLVGNDINRMLQNQRNAIQRESQSRQMLTNLGAPPVKKFSDGGPAGSSSGVRRLKMSGYQEGGDVTDEMFVGTRPEDFPETSAVDKKAGELLRALSEGTRGFVGAEPIEAGSEAYRTGQALANMPAVGVVAATAKGAGKAKDALKSMLPSAKLVDTPEFQNWFGRSKTVNEGGKPLVLYHATPKDITEFIPGGQNPELSGPAIWMTPNKDFQPAAHNLYTGKGSFVSGANVIPLFASVKNPLITSLRTWKDDLKPFGGSPWTLDKEAVSKMKKAGHDGIMYYDEKGNLEEVAVFKPTQVKSAISNEGTFSPRKKAITKAKGGEVTNDEFIQEMMVGTRPSNFPETSPVDTAVSDYLKFQSKAVTDPKAYMQALGENIKKYHTDPLQQDPQKYLMEQLGPGQGLMGAIKPRGGIMPTTPGTPWGEYIDEVVGAAQKSYANIASDRREGVVDFIKKKLDKYIRSDFGTEEDPLRRAIESGRLETFGKDKDTFRSYALKAAREGDPDAVFDVTKAYDIGTGIRPTVMLPTRDFGEGQLAKQKAVDDLVSKIVAEGGDPEIARSIVERQLRSVSRDETDKALQTGEEGYSKVLKTFGVDKNRPKDMGFFERALDQGDIAYGKDFLNLQFLRPQDLAEALGAIPSNKLASMDFPEAVVEGNRLMKKSRDLDENIKIAEKGKGSTLPKEILFFGTKPLKTPAKSGQWINITDPDAARLEGALMRHSVHGYGKEGPYGLGGKQALLSGKANLFSLRDEKGLPMVTVEMENMAMQKMSDREALKTPDFKVRQVQGKFNSAPEDYIDDVFDLAETINGRWSEGPAGNQRYGKDRSGKDLDETKIIEWGKLFANRKAQGKAAGGEITKFIKDNR
jgi:hypothetical protein